MANNEAMEFRIDGAATRDIPIGRLLIAGWTGRDAEAVEAHIRELEEMGVPRPATVPTYYSVAHARLTQAARIEVSGGESSGEVELVLLQDDELLVGLGSDHTDRAIERVNVTVSKQMCDKPIARDLWRYDEVAAHWDQLQLRSFVERDGVLELYQDGTMALVRPAAALLSVPRAAGTWQRGCAMFCGTFAAHGGIRPALRYRLQLHDPVLGRTIEHGYEVAPLPIA